MNHQDVRNQYLQVHGIDPVEIEVEAMFGAEVETISLEVTGPTTISGVSPPPGSVFVTVSPPWAADFLVLDDGCPAAACEDSRDE